MSTNNIRTRRPIPACLQKGTGFSSSTTSTVFGNNLRGRPALSVEESAAAGSWQVCAAVCRMYKRRRAPEQVQLQHGEGRAFWCQVSRCVDVKEPEPFPRSQNHAAQGEIHWRLEVAETDRERTGLERVHSFRNTRDSTAFVNSASPTEVSRNTGLDLIKRVAMAELLSWP